MTSGLGRSYAVALAVVVFFLSWAVIAAKPWVEAPAAKTDPRIAVLDARERRLRKDAVEIRAIVQKRWALYQTQLVRRKHLIALRKKAQKMLLARQQALAAQQAQQVAQQAPSSSYRAAPQSTSHSVSHSAPAPAPPVVHVAPPASPPTTHTKSS